MGMGVQFDFEGKRYDIIDTAHLIAALTSGTPIHYFWNKERFLKYGGTTSVAIKVLYIDTHGKFVSDVVLEMSKKVE